MIIVDTSHGEGGGEILRTSLALPLVTDKPFTIMKKFLKMEITLNPESNKSCEIENRS